ncbi:hypothetical protein CNMCM5623_000629 [Aspergillus felis]|uniref:NmrA-like domain-containing protein n=1 Tax=Aspergillus felis TaxID=1287682 RepID=A0A8H6V6H6_9EURO|nr:hypothetical protein CNMCM5623_000629 [Aspergillus felis]KAF7180688.1 hypothetical protein CNMCM7691_009979 [Aspergillus felis]
MAPSKLIVVLGATGTQGNSVVEAFLTEKDYILRGVTRQPQSEKAQALSKKGVEVALLAKTTFLWFGFYTENLFYPIFTLIYVKSAQKFIQLSPADPSTPIWSVGDHRTNTGIFARAIVKNPPKGGGTFVRCFAEYHSSLNDYLAVWGRASGLSPQLWPGWGEEIGSMMAMWSALQERSRAGLDGDHVLDIDNILSADDRKSVIKTEAAFRALDWKKIL